MNNSILDNVMSANLEPIVSLGDILKVPLVLVLILCIFYAFMLSLKVKILMDTVESDGNNKVRRLVLINLLLSLLLGILGTIIIVLG